MSSHGVIQSPERPDTDIEPPSVDEALVDSRQWQAERLRLLWGQRRFFQQAAVMGMLASTLVAFSIPKCYTSTTQLMPPDSQSSSGMAMMAAFAAKGGGGLGSVAGDLLGLKTTGALFVGVLRSRTSQERLVQQFGLQKVYGRRLITDARLKLDENTSISEDRKSGIITLSVTDRSAAGAAALANAYVNQLNSMVVELSSSSARREREFLEQRLKVVKQDLDDASDRLAQFSSQNNTLDIQQEGRAMLDAAANLSGQMIAAQSQLEGLRQIYTDNNPRVQSLTARVAELRKQLDGLSGASREPGNSAGPAPGSPGGMPYPSIRSLPLLGVKYADYYRHAKMEDTVYELLTEQYELAKAEEAKETPSVKVLDPAKTPERKSSPPRLMIMFLGSFLAFAGSIVWVLGRARWQEADPRDPRRIFVQEVLAQAPWAPQYENGAGSTGKKMWCLHPFRRS
jgi:capsule polysaccharide export protein KpsE/RkpR